MADAIRDTGNPIHLAPEAAEWVVYRFYDNSGYLMYVGSTGSLGKRIDQHAKTQPWWQSVATIKVDRLPDRETMRLTEQASIDLGHPLYNKSRVIGKTPVTGFRIPEDVKAAAVERATAEGETLTDVVVAHLRRYGKTKP